MGARVAQGHITAAPYFQSLDNEINKRCLARFRAQFGNEVEPNMCWEAAYFQVHLYANAMRAAGSDKIDHLLPYLLGSEFDAPQGRVRIDPDNHHTRLYPRIGRLDANCQYELLAETVQGVDPDPYLVNHSVGEWNDPMVLRGMRHGRR
jgi:branched-chain amino acid transport system substrate-binding protein